MSRWVIRVLGLLMLLAFVFLFTRLFNQLNTMQQRQKAPASQSQ